MARVMERRGEGARLLQAALFRTDGQVRRIEVGTAEPLRDALRVRRLFTEKLAALADEWDPGFGFDMVRLSALATAPFTQAQSGLLAQIGDHADIATEDRAEDMAHLIDVLGARFGLRRVIRLVPHDTHIPEFAVAAQPAATVAPSRRGALAQPAPLAEQDT